MLTEQEVQEEITRSLLKHGAFPKDLTRASFVLVGEVLESLVEVRDLRKLPRQSPGYLVTREKLRFELVQVAATCAQWVEILDNEMWRETREADNYRAGESVGK